MANPEEIFYDTMLIGLLLQISVLELQNNDQGPISSHARLGTRPRAVFVATIARVPTYTRSQFWIPVNRSI